MILSKNNEAMYLNPWKRIRDFAEIINLDGKGNIASKLVHRDDLVNIETIGESVTTLNTPHSNNLLLRNGLKKKNVYDTIGVAENRRKLKKSKIMLKWQNIYICHFLSCPNMKKFSILCEVSRQRQQRSDGKESTTCQNVSTGGPFHRTKYWD